jgi:hypothetical protein
MGASFFYVCEKGTARRAPTTKQIKNVCTGDLFCTSTAVRFTPAEHQTVGDKSRPYEKSLC